MVSNTSSKTTSKTFHHGGHGIHGENLLWLTTPVQKQRQNLFTTEDTEYTEKTFYG